LNEVFCPIAAENSDANGTHCLAGDWKIHREGRTKCNLLFSPPLVSPITRPSPVFFHTIGRNAMGFSPLGFKENPSLSPVDPQLMQA